MFGDIESIIVFLLETSLLANFSLHFYFATVSTSQANDTLYKMVTGSCTAAAPGVREILSKFAKVSEQRRSPDKLTG